ALQDGEVAIVLISTWRLDGRKAPHWVVVSGADRECFYIHDPDPADDQVPLDCQ
ncbi:MAG TPA: ribosomal-protein-alanine acetyltransferase, partial [Alcanivorax sp.]|nr:ribosomal-protein-alanine acetyltransferase [Alcanivorax sp.]